MTEERLNEILHACASYQNAIWRHRPMTPAENKLASAAWDRHQAEYNELSKELYLSAIQDEHVKTARALIALTDWAVMQIENIVPLTTMAECWPEEARTSQILAELKAENFPHLAALVQESLKLPTPLRPVLPTKPPQLTPPGA